VNTHKKIFLGLAILMLVSPFVNTAAFVPCGNSGAGVLNVGFLPGNLPYSDWNASTNSAEGFDPLLIQAAAKLLGYGTVNFIGYASNALALSALSAGTIDVYVNSGRALSVPPTTFIGVVTDISFIAEGIVRGWALNPSCCALALQLEAAVTQLVENGTYAEILQTLRLNNLTNGELLGLPNYSLFVTSPTGLGATGVLLEPFDYASSEVGTIPSTCSVAGPVSLPQTNCISAYLQSQCTGVTTFTGATGQHQG